MTVWKRKIRGMVIFPSVETLVDLLKKIKAIKKKICLFKERKMDKTHKY